MDADGSNQRALTSGAGARYSSWSPDGTMVAFDATYEGQRRQLWIMERAGGPPRRITDGTEDTFAPSWSPDGQWIVYGGYPAPAEEGGTRLGEIRLIRPDGSDPRTLASHPRGDGWPTFSPDSQTIVFHSDRPVGTKFDLFSVPTIGGPVQQLTFRSDTSGFPSFSPDGAWLAFHSFPAPEIWKLEVATGDLQRLTDHPASDGMPKFSPDGTRIVFHSDRNGGRDIYLMKADGTDLRRLTWNQRRGRR